MRTATLALLVALAVPAGAQDLESDIFAEGAFDSAVAKGQTADNANKLVWLGGVSLASTTTLVVPQSWDSYGSQSQLAGRGFLKATNPSVGSLFLSYNANHGLWASTNNSSIAGGYAQEKIDPAGPRYTLGELHLSFDFGKLVFVRLGNQLIDWGASAVWSPADFINRKSADPNTALDARSGKPGVRVHVPWSGGNFFLFADVSRSLNPNGTARDLVETGALAGKVDATVGGWNLGLVGNFGKSSDPQLGLTASGALFGVDLWGEAGAVLPVADHTFGGSLSAGGEKSFGDDSEWTIRAEGFFNPRGHDDTALVGPVLASGFTPFYWGKFYLYTEAIRNKLIGSAVTGSLSGTSNLSDRSFSATASLRTAFPGTVPFSVYTQYNGGDANREFTLATGGAAWTWGLRSVLEF
jgi:hypothetical protein